MCDSHLNRRNVSKYPARLTLPVFSMWLTAAHTPLIRRSSFFFGAPWPLLMLHMSASNYLQVRPGTALQIPTPIADHKGNKEWRRAQITASEIKQDELRLIDEIIIDSDTANLRWMDAQTLRVVAQLTSSSGVDSNSNGLPLSAYRFYPRFCCTDHQHCTVASSAESTCQVMAS
jgi:hypothetical protein